VIPYTLLPHLNAALNATSAVLLAAGYWSVRTRRLLLHRRLMLGAVSASCLFLISYIVYHFEVGSVRFQGQGWIRSLYFTILLSHTTLALTLVPLVITTVRRGLRGKFETHRRIARWTLPIWFYVSVTGVVVYGMLYHY
jgi:putative membrane protein